MKVMDKFLGAENNLCTMDLKRRPVGQVHHSWNDFTIFNVNHLLINTSNPETIRAEFPCFASGANIQDDQWCIIYNIFKWNEFTGDSITIYIKSVRKDQLVRAICTLYVIDKKENAIFVGRQGGYFKNVRTHEVARFLKKNQNEEEKFIYEDTLRLRVQLTILMDDISPLPAPQTIELYPKDVLPDNFKLLYKSRLNNGDISLRVRQHLFKLHSHVLELRCPKLLDIILDYDENNDSLGINVESKVLEKIIEFIYLDEINDFDEVIEPLIKISDFLGLNGLKRICEKNLAENYLTIGNADQIEDLAKSVNARKLGSYICSFKRANLDPWKRVLSVEHAERWNKVLAKLQPMEIKK